MWLLGILPQRTLEWFAQKHLFTFQPVSVLEDITDQKTAQNQSATFRCRLQINYPEISLTWYRGTQRLEQSHKYEISSVGDLHCLKVNQCDPSDQGDYRVVCGPHISSATLTVAGKCPEFLCWIRVRRDQPVEASHLVMLCFG